ncbi:hypothetical protein AAIA72_11345 [Hahella sp. SMD15-11]|uniref:Copper-binding protein n=1 Tax=Thermohahella caldifontis TaxID=3142973 RepID=A0AB39UTL1_9GAMM
MNGQLIRHLLLATLLGLPVASWAEGAGDEVSAREIREVRVELKATVLKLVPERSNILVDQPGNAFLGWEAGPRLLSLADAKLMKKLEAGKEARLTIVAPKGASVGNVVAVR